MKLHNSLDEVLGNRTKVQILRTLFQYPGEFTGRHIARLCNLPTMPVLRNLNELASNDLLNVKQAGRSKLFSLNKSNVMYKPLKNIFLAEKSFPEKLEKIIRDYIEENPKIRNKIVHAALFGSFLKQQEEPGSDIDLLLLLEAKTDKDKVHEYFQYLDSKIGTLFGNHLHLYMEVLPKDGKLKSLNRAFIRHMESGKRIYGIKAEQLEKK